MLKRFLRWIGWLETPRPAPRTMRDVWPSLYAVLSEYRPEIIDEVEPFGSQPIIALGAWLDKHFPRQTRWGVESPAHIPRLLRQYMENAK